MHGANTRDAVQVYWTQPGRPEISTLNGLICVAMHSDSQANIDYGSSSPEDG